MRTDNQPHVLVTGGAGFIGSHVVDSLLRDGFFVTVLDNFDPFYPRAQKERNIAPHRGHPSWQLVEGDLRDLGTLHTRLRGGWDAIVHLAAKAGIRGSVQDPIGYYDVNVRGTQNLLELARERGVRQVVFASSSSVYGVNSRVPWREEDADLRPISPYASTKLSAEFLGRVYSHLFGIRFIALRLFTVYGPRQRPDLAIRKFAELIRAGRPLPFYGDGTTSRDYTYVDDIASGIVAALRFDRSMFEIINLGNNRTVTMTEMVRGLEQALGMSATLDRLPEQPGDVPRTWAAIEKAQTLLGYEPRTTYAEGVARFVAWLREAHEVAEASGRSSTEATGSHGATK